MGCRLRSTRPAAGSNARRSAGETPRATRGTARRCRRARPPAPRGARRASWRRPDPLAHVEREGALRWVELGMSKQPLQKLCRIEHNGQRQPGNSIDLGFFAPIRATFFMYLRVHELHACKVEIDGALAGCRRHEQGLGERRDALLPVDDPQRIGARGGIEVQLAQREPRRGSLALPEEQRPDWIAAVNAVKEIEAIRVFPLQPTLETRDADLPFSHPRK